MTNDRDIEGLLDQWFADGADRAPDRVIDAVADRIGRQPQRPAGRLDRRLHPMNTYAKLAVALAAVLVVVVGGLVLLRPGSPSIGGPGPTSSPGLTPSPTPSPTPYPTRFACEDNLAGCAGPLAAGAHHASHFDPRVYLTTPDGWVNSLDEPSIYKLDPADGVSPSILIWSKPAIAQQKPSCDPIPKPGAGTTAADWSNFIASHPGLLETNRVPVDLDGSKGWSGDVSVSAAWTATCPTHGDKPYVMLLANALGGEYGVSAGDTVHLVVVDVVSPSCDPHSGICTKTVVIEVYARGSSLAAVDAIIGTFSFGCGPAFGRGPCGPGS